MKTNYQNTRMLDMIFEHRNKTYGAYALRNNYNSRISQSLFIMLSAVVFICFAKYLSDKMRNNHHSIIEHETIIGLTDITLPAEPEPVIEKPQPKTPPQAQGVNTVRDPEINVVANNNLQDSLPTNEEKSTAEAGLTTNTTGNNIGITDGRGTEPTFTTDPPAPVVTDKVLDIAEVMPKFPGGDEKLFEFLRKKTSFPERESDLGMEGKALVRFVVNEDGSISNVKVLKTDSPGFGKEAVRVVSLMPHFIPGSQQGKPVKVQFVLPFQFRLGS